MILAEFIEKLKELEVNYSGVPVRIRDRDITGTDITKEFGKDLPSQININYEVETHELKEFAKSINKTKGEKNDGRN